MSTINNSKSNLSICHTKPIGDQSSISSPFKTVEYFKRSVTEKYSFKTKGKLIVPIKSGYKLISTSQIEALVADSNYCRIYLSDGASILVSKTLKSLQNQLNENFYRIHKSVLINLDYVAEINKKDSTVIMESQKWHPISRTRKSEFFLIFLCSNT